ncbi:hypothetical protein D1007_47095 [Hordeum vulgare]|nr:hypothetical protein D1007_47095 [Hordeum vulgare]
MAGDVECQIPDGHHEINAARRWPLWFIMVLAVGGVLVVCACTYGLTEYYMPNARYSVALDSISSTDDPKAGLSFNITIGVASQSYGSKACINSGAYMTVAYRAVRLAASGPLTRRLCARPRKAAEQQILAVATAVPVGKVSGGLAAEMKRGVAVFHATLHLPAGSFEGELSPYPWGVGCKGMRAGLGAVPCDFVDQ